MEELVFGMGPVALSQARAAARSEFAARLGDALGAEVDVSAAQSYAELGAMVERGEVHFAWLPPALCVRMIDAGHASLLASSVRGHGARFRGVLFTLDASPIRAIEDARGRSVAWVDEDSCAGYLFPRLALRDRALGPDAFFGKQHLAGSHNAVVRAVALGRADVGATFLDETPGAGAEGRPGWTLEVDARLMRTLLVTDPIPADTICAAGHVDAVTCARATAALTRLHEEERGRRAIGTLFGAHRFERVDVAEYDVVRRALAAR
jgi:phosphonate transport system substrate-binding protein